MRLDSVRTNASWAFADKTQKDTSYATHCFHRYPAKFIPQLAEKLINEHSTKGDTVSDVFAGCGTTLVEAKMRGRKSVGVDINPVACLITEAKITPIDPTHVRAVHEELNRAFADYSPAPRSSDHHERISYWFGDEEKDKLDFILNKIKAISTDDKVKSFFLCAFSNILKNCSIWAQKSNKPTRDFDKKTAEPFQAFNRQVKKMIRGLTVFYDELRVRGHISTEAKISRASAKSCSEIIEDDSVNLIVTSPPYVTSYEYADLHQLSALWLNYAGEGRLSDFRKNFVGSSTAEGKLDKGDPAAETVSALEKESRKLAKSVAGYFSDMRATFREMYKILRVGGRAAIVIGDTKLRGVPIPNAEIFLQYFDLLDMRCVDVIKRDIPSKNIPSARDPKTGRFAKANNSNKVLSYPTEYILIIEKVQ